MVNKNPQLRVFVYHAFFAVVFFAPAVFEGAAFFAGVAFFSVPTVFFIIISHIVFSFYGLVGQDRFYQKLGCKKIGTLSFLSHLFLLFGRWDLFSFP